MKFKTKGAQLAALLVPALALATPAFAQPRDPTFERLPRAGQRDRLPQVHPGDRGLPEGGTAPITELEIGVVCPKGQTCSEHQPIKIRFHWVCGTTKRTQPAVLSAKKPISTSPLRSGRKLFSPPTARPLTFTPLVCRPKPCPRPIVLTGAGI